MRNELRKHLAAALCIFVLITILIAGCSGAAGDGAGGTSKKSYKWNDVEFTVTSVTDDPAVVGDQANKVSGKCVAVTLDFGKKEMSQSIFEGNVAKGMMLLAGKKPTTYNYHMSNMVMGDNGFETQITGETTVFFDMDKDYEVNEEDLVITE